MELRDEHIRDFSLMYLENLRNGVLEYSVT